MLTSCIKNRAFTLIELMVTISIFSIISLSLFIQYPQFKAGVSLKRVAQEIALSVRQAQVYGLSVKGFEGVFPGYGINFDSNTPNAFTLFVDNNNNNAYDFGTDGVGEEFQINTRDRIVDLCGNVKMASPGDCGLDNLDIVYLRPGPQVTLSGNGVSGYSDMEVVLESPEGKQKTIVIWLTGLIEIE